jgi:hypothetical protein
MISELDAATSSSSDIPDAHAIALGSRPSHGTVGRPAVHIDPDELAMLSIGRTRRTQLALIYDCSARTIRRRLLQYGQSQPGPPVYIDEEQADGSVVRIYSAGSSSDLSQLTDNELDQLMVSIYQQFPTFGRRMIDGYLLLLGERVPRSRIEDSYHRAIGASSRTFGPRRIERRVYSVPGPNSLWHHDGQHGKLSVPHMVLNLT